MREHIQIREDGQGWTDSQVIMSLILINLAGGDCVEDLSVLEADERFSRILRRVELCDLSRKQRRKRERRWRKEKRRTVPSPTAEFRYLEAFHDEEEEKKPVSGKAFIPAPNQPLAGLGQVNRDLMRFIQKQSQEKGVRLDVDATLVETQKEEAFYSYKGYKSYQPINVWWAELQVVLHTEFRDGNVPAGYKNLRILKEALGHLPDGVKKARLRSDNAGYQHDLLKYCETKKNKRMKAIRYWIINIPARIIKHSRELIIQLRRGHPSFRLIKDARARIMEMGCVPAG